MPKLNAKPEALDVDFAKSAIVLVDMQNAFASKGGLLDIAGADLADAPRVVRTIRDVIGAARSAGVPVVHLRMAYKADLRVDGGARSPNCHKELAMHMMRARPEYKGKLLTEGTWDAAIVDDLTPQFGDLESSARRAAHLPGPLPQCRAVHPCSRMHSACPRERSPTSRSRRRAPPVLR